MSVDASHTTKITELEDRESVIHDSFQAYGCRVNALDPAELFLRYEAVGFIYPSKMERLRPFLPQIIKNWRMAMRGGELINYFLTYDSKTSDGWGTVGSWRSTHNGWVYQHLASNGCAVASLSVTLATEAMSIKYGRDKSRQSWFRPANKYMSKVYGSLAEALGPNILTVTPCDYIALPFSVCRPNSSKYRVAEATSKDMAMVCHLANRTRGSVYTGAEELEHDDFSLNGLDDLYQRVGLRRYRRILIAWAEGCPQPLAAAVVYRGPLGMNFSFLENRCDLLIAPEATDNQLPDIIAVLCNGVLKLYDDFPLGVLPITADKRSSNVLLLMGGKMMAQYAQCAYLSTASLAVYRHVEKFYKRIAQLEKRRALEGSQPCEP